MSGPLLITSGDPAGVGPELALRGAAWATAANLRSAIVGDAGLLRRVADRLGIELPAVRTVDQFWAHGVEGPTACVVDIPGIDAAAVRPGIVDAQTGRASLDYVNWAIDAALAGRAAGIVTGPIHKEAWHAAGSVHPGHTELLAERTGAPQHCMMLAAPQIRCALVTVHVGLADVASLLSIEAVARTISLAAEAVQRMVGHPPRITVCGLNPHAGESGLFGHGEEEAVIEPAVAGARRQGWRVQGPLPPDTAFLPAIRAQTDVYICMYHDQGLIPLKALAFDEAVNITLGLPIVRTSVDHGTALALAWKGTASDGSMRAAIEMAAQLAAVPGSSVPAT